MVLKNLIFLLHTAFSFITILLWLGTFVHHNHINIYIQANFELFVAVLRFEQKGAWAGLPQRDEFVKSIEG